MSKEFTPDDKIMFNRKYQSKLAWKRIEALNWKKELSEWIDDNFDVVLPISKKDFKFEKNRNANMLAAFEAFPNLINAYYSVGDFGISVGAKFEHLGKIDTYTMGHLFSKHRIDPVWNWRKSQLIRSKYKNFILSNPEIINLYHPVHVVLTLPHPGGLYQGKEFYAAELIKAFRELRRRVFWKKFVYAGEYGVENKQGKQGLHIHIHSLVFLKKKNVNEFRNELRKQWERLTTASQIWAETIFFFKKGKNGRFITELKQTNKIAEYVDEYGDFYADLEKIEVRKKFYVDKEARTIKADSTLSNEDKQQKIIETYLAGIMECIKYHFKGSEIVDNYTLLEMVLENTYNQRLYNRFGAFAKESELAFNPKKTTEDPEVIETEDLLAEAVETACNPFTKEEVESTKAQLVTFYPNQQRRQPATSPDAFALINNQDNSIYTEMPSGLTVKRILSITIKEKFGKGEKMKEREM